MPKNIIFLYGMCNEIRKYINESVTPGRENINNENIYVSINSLTTTLGLERERGIKQFFENTLKVKKHMSSTHKLLVNDNIKKSLQNPHKNILIEKGISKILLENWLQFLYQNKNRLSISQSLSRKQAKSSIKGDYRARFLNKNITNSHPDLIVPHYTDLDESYDTDEEQLFTHNHFPAINAAFNTFITQGDDAGFNFLINLEAGMTIYPDLQENVYIVQSFVTAFLRKASKLALEWLDTEINRSTSPISGLRFITDYVAESVHDYHPATLHNIHAYHHPSGSTYLNAGNNYYPITFSENRAFENQNFMEKNLQMTQVTININEVVKAQRDKAIKNKKTQVLRTRILNRRGRFT
ncbi:hypothetical protein [Xenorhabdus cabanillasii]|uniref:Uncharacterized protein n=2 Tax=Xenorhabdus cabanillasii TaxID=351673 RepID=A0A3D9UBL4_9GAMM|nr:hypothetical protein [Xenorhabdus cabanillasii]PHM77019.1 hypothetical protein Xcab_02437 [Xenorhabdus cabanillasii JM26]REF26656.1 hypothetical protein BDD26_1328 [Xenorhabdus cabanillasii]CDL85940.1 hypothetical protein XCR1_2650019 [Xenorhabdus cabanillasii JM26]